MEWIERHDCTKMKRKKKFEPKSFKSREQAFFVVVFNEIEVNAPGFGIIVLKCFTFRMIYMFNT